MYEEEFILDASVYLRNFKKIGSKYQCSCNLCGDSKKDPKKARGSIYMYQGDWFFNCYNCGKSLIFYKWLQTINEELYKKYLSANFSKRNRKRKYRHKPKQDEPFTVTDDILRPLTFITEAPEAYQYLKDRMLPENMILKFYYTANFKRYVNFYITPDKYSNTEYPDPRVVLPFYDAKKRFLGIQGRSLRKDAKLKYLSIKTAPERIQFKWGMDRIDFSKSVFVLEGPIDAMFIDNAVGFASANLYTVRGLTNPILVYDNEPYNTQIVDQIEKSIDKGFDVVIWDKKNPYKDVNEMLLNGMQINVESLKKMSISNLQAKLKFNEWKKQ